MNIYIYGNQRFKKEIYKILDSSQIKKIDNNVIIKEISNLNDLKETIKAQPKDIYLIDDEKIIKKYNDQDYDKNKNHAAHQKIKKKNGGRRMI